MTGVIDGPCDVAGCERTASVALSLAGLVSLAPRRTLLDPVPLCDRHSSEIASEVERQIGKVLEPLDPNRNSSNRAMSSEDLGDAEE